jgi:dinuclear metal center YbgI/SA1388 family protein
MSTVAEVADFLEAFAPPRLAEEWDNVGLLVGDRTRPLQRAMTCLTITQATAQEAIHERAELVVTHHPLPFRPLKRITVDTPEGRLLWELIGAQIAVYSPHTAFDSAAEGINQRLAEGLELREIAPLVPQTANDPAAPLLGAGRYGDLPNEVELSTLAQQVKRFLKVDRLQRVGDAACRVRRVAVACGSAGEFLGPASEHGCDCLVTGETRFHTCLEAEARGIALLLAGHYASERFGVEGLAAVLAERFSDIVVWASRQEHDPLEWI